MMACGLTVGRAAEYLDMTVEDVQFCATLPHIPDDISDDLKQLHIMISAGVDGLPEGPRAMASLLHSWGAQ